MQPSESRLGRTRLFRRLAGVTVALILVQALLAGRGWFLNHDLIKIHGDVGSATFLVVVVQTIVAFVAWRRGVRTQMALGLSAVLLVLVFAQIGLGFGGRTSGDAAA
jgi:hypothetical protein